MLLKLRQNIIVDIICPMQLRLKSGATMVSERMLMPQWAKAAATRLSDEELAFSQIISPAIDWGGQGADSLCHQDDEKRTVSVNGRITRKRPSGAIASSGAFSIEKEGESVAGTVSRKGKFGFTCISCNWVPAKGGLEDWQATGKGGYVGLHFPERCRKCRSRMKRWTCAARNYDKLELLRQLEGRHCLRFVTFTKDSWNKKVPIGEIGLEALGPSPLTL